MHTVAEVYTLKLKRGSNEFNCSFWEHLIAPNFSEGEKIQKMLQRSSELKQQRVHVVNNLYRRATFYDGKEGFTYNVIFYCEAWKFFPRSSIRVKLFITTVPNEAWSKAFNGKFIRINCKITFSELIKTEQREKKNIHFIVESSLLGC